MILRVQAGSGAHGTAVSGQDDRDEMGVCLEPRQFVTGLARPSPRPRRGWPNCGTARRSRNSLTGNGSMTGCTAAISSTGPP
jgi:RNA repair pathway DNA polymerase beta family protein